jgi:hypothetical protein
MANAYINSVEQLSPSDLLYINTKKQLKANIITIPNTVIFTGASILQPSLILPSTTINDFEFYINGLSISSLIASFNSYGGGVSISFNIDQLGYNLETDDEVIAIGKFA